MTTEQERADFAEWLYGINSPIDVTECDSKDIEMMCYAYQAGRDAVQSQDREDADQWFEKLRILITDFGIACADSGAVEMYMMPKIFDHARRIEGEGE